MSMPEKANPAEAKPFVVGKGGVNVHARKGQPGNGTTVGVGEGGGVNVRTRKGKPDGGTTVGVGKGKTPFHYFYAASEDQLHDDRTSPFSS